MFLIVTLAADMVVGRSSQPVKKFRIKIKIKQYDFRRVSVIENV